MALPPALSIRCVTRGCSWPQTDAFMPGQQCPCTRKQLTHAQQVALQRQLVLAQSSQDGLAASLIGSCLWLCLVTQSIITRGAGAVPTWGRWSDEAEAMAAVRAGAAHSSRPESATVVTVTR